MTDKTIKSLLETLLSQEAGQPVSILSMQSLGGGCINQAARLKTGKGIFFAKWNTAGRYPGMFEAEARGLQKLGEAAALKVPRVIALGDDGRQAALILEFIEEGPNGPGFWEDFGRGMSGLHRHSADRFGLDHQNYIGSLPQDNQWEESWAGFFVNRRIEPQWRMARDRGRAPRELEQALQRLFLRLDDIFPPEPPALLHGDLWSGNFMGANHNQAVLVDPAVYYGHRYMDLGMSLLFGGFSPEFYTACHEAWPLENDWRRGADLANLYPLLVHLNLFGESYLSDIRRLLRPF